MAWQCVPKIKRRDERRLAPSTPLGGQQLLLLKRGEKRARQNNSELAAKFNVIKFKGSEKVMIHAARLQTIANRGLIRRDEISSFLVEEIS